MYYCAPGYTFACSVHVLKSTVFCIIKVLKRPYFDTIIMCTNPALVLYSDSNVRKHYRLQYNTTRTFGSGYETRELPHCKR